MAGQNSVYIGIRGTVLSLEASTGAELWRTELAGADFVNVALMDGKIYAATRGEMFALDRATGAILWRNELKNLGLGFITIAGGEQIPAAALAKMRRDSDGAIVVS